MGGPSILHVDLDAFYASVEQLRNPKLRGRPVVVGGGVVLAASYEARRFGVHSGMPTGKARLLCPGVIVVSGRFSDYGAISDTVFAACRRFTPLVEQTSIDEAFLDVSGAHHLFGSGAEIGGRIRAAVLDETGLVVSVGVARTKFLAKVASRVAKPNGLVTVPVDDELAFLHRLPVRFIWGVGPVTEARLATLGIASVADLANTPSAALAARLGTAGGRHLLALAWNRDSRRVEARRRAGSVGAQSTFGRDVESPAVHRRVLMRLSERVGGRLRAKFRAGRTITVRARFSDFETVTRCTTVRVPVASTAGIYTISTELLKVLLVDRAAGRGLRLLGVSVSKLAYSPHVQLELPFADLAVCPGIGGGLRDQAELRLDTAVDSLRNRFGKSAVGRASVLLDSGSRGLVADEFSELMTRQDV
ncbi:MAG: DNA polymerase IV [Acidimicrobiia bacterium]